MIHIFLNGLSASSGGGLTYFRNVLPELSTRTDVRATALLPALLCEELGDLPSISFLDHSAPSGSLRRFLWEQVAIPDLIRKAKADVLLSAGNFAISKSPVPQILLSGNALYSSGPFYEDLLRRRDYGMWLDTKLKGMVAKHSVHTADVTVAPSVAFAEELSAWTGRKVVAIHHGFDAKRFCANQDALPEEIQQKITASPGVLRLLFVSHYNYYRNFETLFRALPLIKEKLGRRSVVLVLTCRLGSSEEPGSYRADAALQLIRELDLRETIVELGTVPYHSLHHLYRACDLYVTPAFVETFAHPLVEAMSCGTPIVASNLAVHQEICGDAAVFFPPMDANALATTVASVVASEGQSRRMSTQGLERFRQFSWAKHVQEILLLAVDLMR